MDRNECFYGSRAIQSEYSGSKYPCSDVKIECGIYSCNMDYNINEDAVQSVLNVITNHCYYIHVPALQDLTCKGQCIDTHPPTTEPTSSPITTRVPTIANVYDSYIKIEYQLQSLSPQIIKYISESILNVMDDIRIIIENGYVNHQDIARNGWSMQYEDFWLKLNKINDDSITKLGNNPRVYTVLFAASENDRFIINSQIECEEFWCDYTIYIGILDLHRG